MANSRRNMAFSYSHEELTVNRPHMEIQGSKQGSRETIREGTPHANEANKPRGEESSISREDLDAFQISRLILVERFPRRMENLKGIQTLRSLKIVTTSGQNIEKEILVRLHDSWTRRSSSTKNFVAMATGQVVFEGCVLLQEANTCVSKHIFKCTNRMYFVDSGASVHMTRTLSLTPEQKSKMQPRVASRSLRPRRRLICGEVSFGVVFL